MFWIGVGIVLAVVLTAGFVFDRRHRNSRGGGDARSASPDADLEVGRHDGPNGGGYMGS